MRTGRAAGAEPGVMSGRRGVRTAGRGDIGEAKDFKTGLGLRAGGGRFAGVDASAGRGGPGGGGASATAG